MKWFRSRLAIALVLAAVPAVQAQVAYEVLHEFEPPPSSPSTLLRALDGALYGTTGGGPSGYGTLFRYDLATSALTTLHLFNKTSGAYPVGTLIQGADGFLYGTTAAGGASDSGTVFRYDLSTSTHTTLHSFSSPEGSSPLAALVQGSDGALYGTTYTGGASDRGTVFRYDLPTSTFASLHSFNTTNGAYPYGAVIQGLDGALYGTTVAGGASDRGTIFRYDRSTSTLSTLHGFNGMDGATPYAAVIQGLDGALYGTTLAGGASEGTVFRYDLSTATHTTLHTFNFFNGSRPQAAVVQGSDGALYGTTSGGGPSNRGTVFRYQLSTSTLTTLHSFDSTNENGAYPLAALIQGPGGALYGTTSRGGESGRGLGTLFRYDPSASTLTTLHRFSGTNGSYPAAAVIRGADGALYGTTGHGGASGGGTVFRYDPATSTLTTLHSFNGANGATPNAAVIQGSDGVLYGTTYEGGGGGLGTVFRYALSTSTLTTLHTFNNTDGARPSGALIQASDGALYGTTSLGGASARGTLFRYDLAASMLITLHNFNQTTGVSPGPSVIQGADGALYGTTSGGGASNRGTVFRYDLSTSTLTTLHNFNNTSGAPLAAVMQGSDGALYGTTSEGPSDRGTMFRYDLSTSTLTTLHAFNNTNGAYPSTVIQGSDGALYGTTSAGGASDYGTVFRYDLSTSTFTTLHNFNNANGAYPQAALLQGLDGGFYGTASQGGPRAGGVIFRVSLLPPNTAPLAANDTYATSQDGVLNVAAPGVLGNDSDVDGDTLAAAVVTGPAHGSLTLNADGSFTYTPEAGFFGSDSFTYSVTDGNGGSAQATVTITVTEAALFKDGFE